MWNNPYFVIAFLLGILIIFFSSVMFLLPKAKSHLFIKLLFDITYIAQMICIFMFSNSYVIFAGIASNAVGAVRDIAFMKTENDEYRFYWTIGLTMMMIFLMHFTYSNFYSYLPAIGTLINTVALSFKNKRNACLLTIFGQLFFISYYVALLQDSDLLTLLNVIAALMLLVSAAAGFILSFKKSKKNKQILQ